MEDEWLPQPRYMRVWVVPLLLGVLHLALAVVYFSSIDGWPRFLFVASSMTWAVLAVKWHRDEAQRE